MKIAKKIAFWAFVVTLAAAVVYMVWGIVINLNATLTSFPWWTACVFALFYFGPILALELAVYLFLRIKLSKD